MKRIEGLEEELASKCMSCVATEGEVASQQEHIKTLMVVMTLHAHAELMEELKARKHGSGTPIMRLRSCVSISSSWLM